MNKYRMLFNAMIWKYGFVKENYVKKIRGRLSKNPDISRYAAEGLYVHHYFECKVPNLSEWKVMKANDKRYQESQTLCYCNLWEHYMLHKTMNDEGMGSKKGTNFLFALVKKSEYAELLLEDVSVEDMLKDIYFESFTDSVMDYDEWLKCLEEDIDCEI